MTPTATTAAAVDPVNPGTTTNLIRLIGTAGNPLVRLGGVTGTPLGVSNDTLSPGTTTGWVKLAVPALTNNPLKNDFYKDWIYALTPQGLYVTKDRGNNWTLVKLPEVLVGGVLQPFGTNNINDPSVQPTAGYDNFAMSVAVDPVDPNVVYVGGQVTIRIDTTKIKDPQNFTLHDNSLPDGGQFQGNTTGGVDGNSIVLVYDASIRNYVASTTDFLNLKRDPDHPFPSPSSIPVTIPPAREHDVHQQRHRRHLADDGQLQPARPAVPHVQQPERGDAGGAADPHHARPGDAADAADPGDRGRRLLRPRRRGRRRRSGDRVRGLARREPQRRPVAGRSTCRGRSRRASWPPTWPAPCSTARR